MQSVDRYKSLSQMLPHCILHLSRTRAVGLNDKDCDCAHRLIVNLSRSHALCSDWQGELKFLRSINAHTLNQHPAHRYLRCGTKNKKHLNITVTKVFIASLYPTWDMLKTIHKILIAKKRKSSIQASELKSITCKIWRRTTCIISKFFCQLKIIYRKRLLFNDWSDKWLP